MNREGAETYLRLLAEAEMRDFSGPPWRMPWSEWAGGSPAGHTCRKLQLVAHALTTVDALEASTAEAILADFDLAVTARPPDGPDAPALGPAAWPASGISGPAMQAVTARIRARGVGPGMAGPLPPPPSARRGPVPATLAGSAAAARPPGPERPTGDGPSVPERFMPIGVAVPFHHEMSSGRLYLMAYARTAAGARLTVSWHPHSHDSLGVPEVGFCTVTDDRGRRYHLDFTLGTSSGPHRTGVIALNPSPPGDPRWLDICPPGGTAVRIGLDSPGPAETADAETAKVSQIRLGPGEHLLTLIAERLLAGALDLRRDPRQEMPPPGPLSTMAAGLGEVVAALEAAEALAPDSPLPGRLATLCANLTIDAPGLAAPPSYDLPEPWLSALAHYHRRKPDAGASHDETPAALAAALPELDGIRLALLGLKNADGHTWLYVLASGLTSEFRHGHLATEMNFPLSVWILDSGGRWHLARPAGRNRVSLNEELIRLRLSPALSRSATWIEALAAGRSAQARVRLPLRWDAGYE